MIVVTQPFLPPKEEYEKLLDQIWSNKWLTNQGPLVQKLEKELQDYLQVNSLLFVTNGTSALQLAIKGLELSGEIITTPFSFVATTTAIIWENCTPVFVDINPETLCIDANKIEAAITERTSAIVATHVYGIPCDVEKIEAIASKHKLKVIYDAAHAFGVKYKGKSVLSYGDISTLSFHATKLFHTIEGGGIINNTTEDLSVKLQLLRNFGFKKDNYLYPGINAKNSEFHAAMGLCNLKYFEDIILKRVRLTSLYDEQLNKIIKRPLISEDVEYNYSYYPVIFNDENELLKVLTALETEEIFARRYFYPSLNSIKYTNNEACPISEDIASRVLCLPFYYDLEEENVLKICNIIKSCLGEI